MFPTYRTRDLGLGGCGAMVKLLWEQRIYTLRPIAWPTGAWPDAQGELLHTTAACDVLDDIHDMDKNDNQARGRVS